MKNNFFIYFICLLLKKLINGKYFLVKEEFNLIFRKIFSFILDIKHFLKVMKNLEMSYYLLIILNLIIKLLIVIYILFWIFYFQFHPLKFDFYINFSSHFMVVIYFYLIIFLIEIFYLSNFILIFLLLLILFKIIHEIVIIIVLFFLSFNFFIC